MIETIEVSPLILCIITFANHPTAIRKATTWYNHHLSQSTPPPKIILVTDDVANRRQAEKEGLFSLSSTYPLFLSKLDTNAGVPVRKYIQSLEKDAPLLLDLLSADTGDEGGIEPTPAVAARKPLYPDVSLSPSFITTPLKKHPTIVSPFDSHLCRHQSRSITPRSFQP